MMNKIYELIIQKERNILNKKVKVNRNVIVEKEDWNLIKLVQFAYIKKENNT